MVAGPELADAASLALGTKMHFKSITEYVESSATSQSHDDEIFDRGNWAAVPLIHTKSDRRRRRSSIRPKALKWTRVSGRQCANSIVDEPQFFRAPRARLVPAYALRSRERVSSRILLPRPRGQDSILLLPPIYASLRGQAAGDARFLQGLRSESFHSRPSPGPIVQQRWVFRDTLTVFAERVQAQA
jgi:hypothetical protein